MIKNEWKSLWNNKILIIVVMAIIVIPVIYAGLFLKSMWDPYGNLDKLPVAVVNNDKSVEYNGKTLSVGSDMVDELKDNDSLDFHFVDSDEAQQGLKNGTYYMVITIPEDFSSDASTLMDDNPKKMELKYETNPGTNYIASKMSETALSKIREAVASKVTETYTQTVFDQIGTVGDGMQEAAGSFRGVVAAAAGVKEDEILGEDLSLYVRTRGTCFGAKNEFILAPRLDDLGCVFGLLEGFLAAKASGSVPVFCAFDNEEVGSQTKQGAASSLLSDTLRRIALALGLNEEGYLRMLAQSFLVSADNAHGVHPNHPEYADMTNTPRLNGGVVIKFNANQRYTTDGVSCALFTAVCREAGAPVQVYANRSDMPGGSTLGSIATTKVSVPSVDIGLAQLAMHSCVETAGAEDLDALVKAMTCYYGKTLTRSGEQITF